VLHWRAVWRSKVGGGTDAPVTEGLAAVERALDLNPSSARAEAVGGQLELVRARAASDDVRRREAALRSVARLQRAIGMNRLLDHELAGYLAAAEALVGERPPRTTAAEGR
jgi:hypothetical protein